MTPEAYEWLTPIYCIGSDFMHRSAVVGAPNPAIIYSTYVFNDHIQRRVDWHKAIGNGGHEIDIDDLFPELGGEETPLLTLPDLAAILEVEGTDVGAGVAHGYCRACTRQSAQLSQLFGACCGQLCGFRWGIVGGRGTVLRCRG